MLVNARAPVAFFAYPDKPSLLLPPACEVMTLADPAEDGIDAIERLADALGAARIEPVARAAGSSAMPTGARDAPGLAAVIAALMPEARHRRGRVDHVGARPAAGDAGPRRRTTG